MTDPITDEQLLAAVPRGEEFLSAEQISRRLGRANARAIARRLSHLVAEGRVERERARASHWLYRLPSENENGRGRRALRPELAEVLEINTRSRLYQLLDQKDFPEPVEITYGGTPLWDVATVRRWHREQRKRRAPVEQSPEGATA